MVYKDIKIKCYILTLNQLAFLKCVFLLFSLDFYNVFKNVKYSTKVNVNYVESSIDILKFYQRVLDVGAK